ncbi:MULTISPECIES: SDR family oxidoreductase [unclassified Brevibacterium]|jgi:NAD(P)-dependent dehydrogenase (short-subunit alcohol dehydrogenase family)|uniref:SDR family NAD(P)-dependent oxidoreductase n=1 Tax=unclassified Brevibacterium TaxID=2614124 RepID=UPI001BAE4846|nr:MULTISPECIES: SDR family oxidoreductase [unclassified Brevibacterium]QUL79666.1 SDR family oxidoreductase [Brevibacterium sp. SMBL_HHYL_HB1]HJA61420.1 SDR family oxidoreductase [Candidatus Brevibacterium intestinavium]
MDLRLAGKTIFISGSTQGIGYAIASLCAHEGATVILNGRHEDGVEAALARLRESDPAASVRGIAADFADARQVDELLGGLGEVDILINNVGLFDVAPFAEIDDAEWSRYFEVNLMSAVRLSRRLLPGMLEKGWGRVVFIGTESAVDVPGDMVHYGATKAAALALSNGLAKLTRGTEVTVNTVLGGPTYSDGVAASIERIAAAQSMPAADLRDSLVRDTSLLQRFIAPSEIANLVAYLASPLSSATNGAALRADGGVLPTV